MKFKTKERANTHDSPTSVLLWTSDAQFSRVKTVRGRRGDMFGILWVHHRCRFYTGYREGHGAEWERTGRVHHAISCYRVQAVQRRGRRRGRHEREQGASPTFLPTELGLSTL